MTFKQLKKEFAKFNYDLEYMAGNEGKGYYLRKFGSVGYDYYENSRAAIEARLEAFERNNQY